jgi:AraC family transcriptional regulator
MSGIVSALLKVGTLGRQEFIESAGGFLFTKTVHSSGTVLGRHGHVNASVVVVIGGGYQETFKGVSDVHRAGTVIAKPPGESHANCFGDHSATCLLIEPDEDAFGKIRDHSDLLDQPSSFSSPIATAIAHQIVRELRHPDALTPLQLESAALSLIVRCRRSGTQESARESRMASQARALVHELPPGSAALSGIAAQLEVHPVYLARAFKRAFGLSIGGYARRIQVERALDMLVNSRCTIGEIAQAAGFYDQSHMSRVLRQQTGLSASDIRRSAAS